MQGRGTVGEYFVHVGTRAQFRADRLVVRLVDSLDQRGGAHLRVSGPGAGEHDQAEGHASVQLQSEHAFSSSRVDRRQMPESRPLLSEIWSTWTPTFANRVTPTLMKGVFSG